MGLLAFGINHKTASVALRERAAFTPESLVSALREAREQGGLRELAILSTCNRTEFYGALPDGAADTLLQWLSAARGIPPDELRQVWYCHDGDEAVRHAMRVASGLDSMILGEPQILGQMKSAYAEAVRAGTLGAELERLFQGTFAAAKQVRSETDIGSSPVSIGFAAVTLARQVFESLADAPVLLVGAGEMNALVARHLREQGAAELMLVNRTLARAEALAAEVGGEAMPWSLLTDALTRADMVVSCTGSTEPVISVAQVKAALKRRRHRPLLLIDIAVPRDIDPAVAELDDVFLYTVDDLQSVIDAGWRTRQAAAAQAETLIAERVRRFAAQQRVQQEAVAMIRGLREQAQQLAALEQRKALDSLRQGGDPEAVLARFQHNLVNKWLHAPTVGLRQLAASGEDELVTRFAALLGVSVPEAVAGDDHRSDQTGDPT
ncbi:glutamyl-tRNA reductase [Amnimonas aquatica]|uniref:Glutamyl-tRNA reductase n=1 Tax=Amnimonas aquatica TaxID=2094561 RepID=A0A2P6ATN8_9GAMM|nr:glutamyl-tRNA reductase [Amnimonas aquatica]PQA48240.1 glutamyl-tRNA reductase [Amnimonas aquatica]